MGGMTEDAEQRRAGHGGKHERDREHRQRQLGGAADQTDHANRCHLGGGHTQGQNTVAGGAVDQFGQGPGAGGEHDQRHNRQQQDRGQVMTGVQ